MQRAAVARWPLAPTAALLFLTACTDAFRPQFVAEVRVLPDSAHLEPGDAVAYEAVPLDDRGAPMPERAERVQWTLRDAGFAALDPEGATARLTASAPGTARVDVELGRGRRTVVAHIRPPGLASIAIEPSPVELATTERVSFRAVLLDAAGAELDPGGFRISWAVDEEDIGLVSVTEGPASNVFGRAAGTTRLTLVVNDRVVRTDVIVR